MRSNTFHRRSDVFIFAFIRQDSFVPLIKIGIDKTINAIIFRSLSHFAKGEENKTNLHTCTWRKGVKEARLPN